MDPITEASNPITVDVDLADPTGIVQLLGECDVEIFSGWRLNKSLYDESIRISINQVAKIASSIINDDNGLIVLSGCGTSGRIAFFISRTFNQTLSCSGSKQAKFRYTIAGGDRALLLSTEVSEDSYKEGVEDLERVTRNAKTVLFVGITCGLSAPYVAGQLDYCLTHSDKYTSVLIGFNPIQFARKVPISGWDKTFYDVAMEMERVSQNAPTSFIINPIVGPEQITGSSRMKSGSCTKIILETIFYIALNKVISNDNTEESFPVEKIFQTYEYVCRETYLKSTNTAILLDRAGYSLNNGGRICYLGKDNLGIMAIIDASECPPTYGSSYNDVRGFIEGGWNTLQNNESDLSHRGPEYQLSIDYFRKTVLSTLTKQDTVVFVLENATDLSDFESILNELQATQCHVGIITTTQPPAANTSVALTVSAKVVSAILSSFLNDKLLSYFMKSLSEISVKWVLNAISTGAHVMKGKVVGNRMVDLQVSNSWLEWLYIRCTVIRHQCMELLIKSTKNRCNSKLYHRAIGIIQTLSEVDKSIAEEKLLSSIYSNKSWEANYGINEHIQTATGQTMVVPRAILMARTNCTFEEANDRLKANPIVRKALSTSHTH